MREKLGRDLATHIVEDFSLYKWDFFEIFWMDLEEILERKWLSKKVSESEKRICIESNIMQIEKDYFSLEVFSCIH